MAEREGPRNEAGSESQPVFKIPSFKEVYDASNHNSFQKQNEKTKAEKHALLKEKNSGSGGASTASLSSFSTSSVRSFPRDIPDRDFTSSEERSSLNSAEFCKMMGAEDKENRSLSETFTEREFHASRLGIRSEEPNSVASVSRTEAQTNNSSKPWNSSPGLSSPQVFSQNRNAIVVSRRQQGNPVLKFIRNIRWVFGDIVPDYYLGNNTCALYLSLRYHLLHPDYVYFRIRELKNAFRLRVLICYVDIQDVIKPLHDVTKTALLHDITLICAWSLQECARYLETFKSYENKPADLIQERTDNDYLSKLSNCLTVVRHVNKTDVLTLGNNFSTLSSIFQASVDELSRCPGIGEKKLKRLHDAFHQPFKRNSKQLRLDSSELFSKPISNSKQSSTANSPNESSKESELKPPSIEEEGETKDFDHKDSDVNEEEKT